MGYLYLCCVYLLFVLSEVVWVSLAVQMALITLEGRVEIFYLCCVFIVCTQRGGFGEFSSSDGTNYVGGWSGDHITGKGCMTYSNGDCYDGNWFKNTVSLPTLCAYAQLLICEIVRKNRAAKARRNPAMLKPESEQEEKLYVILQYGSVKTQIHVANTNYNPELEGCRPVSLYGIHASKLDFESETPEIFHAALKTDFIHMHFLSPLLGSKFCGIKRQFG